VVSYNVNAVAPTTLKPLSVVSYGVGLVAKPVSSTLKPLSVRLQGPNSDADARPARKH
jgi:hypothetical protein